MTWPFEHAKPILCVGDGNVDYFVNGSVSRISPEAPVPVLRIISKRAFLGGAGNVARNLAKLHVPVRLVCAIGNDDAGDDFLNACQTSSYLEPYLWRSSKMPTTVKTRFCTKGHHLLRTDEELGQLGDTADLEGLIDLALKALKGCGALILSDYARGVIAPDMISSLVFAARQSHIPVLADPKGRNFKKYNGVTLLTPNHSELHVSTGLPTETEAQIIEAAHQVLKETGVEGLLVTRGPQGMILIPREGEPLSVPTKAREVYDVSGAGDTVISVMAAGLASGLSLAETVPIANIAAGIVVGKTGTAPITRRELKAALTAAPEHGIFTWSEAEALVRDWHARGLKIGFTNGCFDLLHPGHIDILTKSRALCDRLIVGINTDDSVKRLKGPARPIQQELARATVLSALECVNAAVLFDQDTPLELIQTLRPDILIKGADYTIDTIVGAKEVLSWGGEVKTVPLVPDQSTTRLVERMAG